MTDPRRDGVKPPPNIVFIITDQHRADHLGCYGNKIVKTPHIDALAARGMRGTNCTVTSPICMPSRASFMTGRMPSVHGVRHNGIELSHAEMTITDALMMAGYETALAGKSHLQCMLDAPPQIPVDPRERLAREARPRAPGVYNQEVGARWENDPAHDLTLPYYGFNNVHLTIEHGDDELGHWRRWLRQTVKEADKLIGVENAIPTPEIALVAAKQAWRTRVPEELYPTSWITDRTIDLMRDFTASQKPFFIQVSYPDPHHPFTPPGKYWSMYRPEDVDLPPSFHAEHRGLPPHVASAWAARDAGKAVKHTPMLFACTEREAREAIALNYGSISMIDDNVGRIVAELERLGIADNTIIVFTADHADYMGDHQLLLKGPLHFRDLIRVPFIWVDPAMKNGGRVTDAMIQNIDFAPTILERTGAEPWYGIQGRSLAPLLAGETDSFYDDVLIEEESQRRYLCFTDRVKMRSLVTPTHRLSVFSGQSWGELYDLRDDPLETVNLFDDPVARAMKGELMERLNRRMLDYIETSPYPDYVA